MCLYFYSPQDVYVIANLVLSVDPPEKHCYDGEHSLQRTMNSSRSLLQIEYHH
jgi:hypothetical protein